MFRRTLIAAWVAIFLHGGQALAQERGPKTVQDLLRSCKQDGNDWFMYCAGMANGVIGTFIMVARTDGKGSVCFPSPGITNGQIIQAFINWAEKNPTLWQWPGVSGMVLSTAKTWPCK